VGGAGNDTLRSGAGGNDQAFGETGNDVVFWGPPAPAITNVRFNDAVPDLIHGGGTVFGAVTFKLAAGTYNNGSSFTESWVNFENYFNTGPGSGLSARLAPMC
jgi:hypothetical protein